MRPPAPTYTAHLLEPIHRELVALLHTLTPAEWLAPTAAGEWRVRDVVAHLLDGDLRRLSYHRDRLPQPELATLRTYDDVLGYLNGLNGTWVAAAARISPRLLTQLVEEVGRQAVEFLASLPPHEVAYWPVSWAGEGRSENWMDVSRNYTEYWHHQQQIRYAVGRPPLDDARWLRPVIALGVRAIPPALRKSDAAVGATIDIQVTGAAGGRWWLEREDHDWVLSDEAPPSRAEATATIEVDGADAARVWYAGRQPQPAAARARIAGDTRLAGAVLSARALMV
jgi:uncharacterized protein (TIGR03083 family)